MDEKPRVARIRLTKSSSPPENAAGEALSVFEAGSPEENISQEAIPPEDPDKTSPLNPAVASSPSLPVDNSSASGISFPAEDTGESWEDSEEAWQEDEETEEQERAFWLAEKKRVLFNALFILGILYVICGIIPLVLPFFVPLRVFVWTEVVGWVIIIAWLLIGVRKPLLDWMKARAETRKEQAAG